MEDKLKTDSNELLLQRDSALARWPDRRTRPLRVWVQPESTTPDFSSGFPDIVRAALQRLLSDEVHHAQLGWAFLASPAAPARALTTGWLVPLLEGYREYVVRRTTAHPAIDLPAHGCASPAEWLSQYLDVVEQLILPGFEHVGVSTDRARDWLTGAKML